MERFDRERRPGLLPDPGADGADRICAARQSEAEQRPHPHDISRSDQRLRREIAMSRSRLVTAAALALACAMPAQGHQLDEYLQAARIGLEPDRIVVEMSLTPGAAVARQIFSSLDRDGDGRISAPETASYAETVRSDLVLELDGRTCPVRLLRAGSPRWSEMREGVGTIRLNAECGVPVSRGRHRLRF